MKQYLKAIIIYRHAMFKALYEKVKEKPVYCLFFILALGIFLRWHYFFGIDFDGAQYTLQAKHIADGVYDPTNINHYNQGIRYGMLLPIALMHKMFGVSDFTSFFFQFLFSITQIVIVYYFGKYLFN